MLPQGLARDRQKRIPDGPQVVGAWKRQPWPERMTTKGKERTETEGQISVDRTGPGPGGKEKSKRRRGRKQRGRRGVKGTLRVKTEWAARMYGEGRGGGGNVCQG